MSYNNTRNYGRPAQQQQRYNTTGQFVSAGELTNPSTPGRATRASAAAAATNYTNMYPSGSNPPPPLPQSCPIPDVPVKPFYAQAPEQPSSMDPPPMQLGFSIVEQAKAEPMEVVAGAGGGTLEKNGEVKARPAWMKSGIKKISNKERRRRQNEHLRKLLTPKNALMVLNEMMPGEQLASNFSVEAAPPNSMFFRQEPGHKYCAGLALDGQLYKGFGENKMTARNAAAEQAIRDLVIKRMTKALAASTSTADITEDIGDGAAAVAGAGDSGTEAGEAGAGAGETGAPPENDTLPMIQLASYALHKLFSEWQYEGFQVPLLKRNTAESVSGGDSETTVMSLPRTKMDKKTKTKELPADAARMHPCMLLTQMRPDAKYSELGSEGDKPQNMLFTMGVTVEGTTYIGKASNKKEARKLAARSACSTLLNVQFAEA